MNLLLLIEIVEKVRKKLFFWHRKIYVTDTQTQKKQQMDKICFTNMHTHTLYQTHTHTD